MPFALFAGLMASIDCAGGLGLPVDFGLGVGFMCWIYCSLFSGETVWFMLVFICLLTCFGFAVLGVWVALAALRVCCSGCKWLLF